MGYSPWGQKESEMTEGSRFHHTTQDGKQFKTYELLISGIFLLIFSDRG